jgi:Cu/Ag efflux protein CusF
MNFTSGFCRTAAFFAATAAITAVSCSKPPEAPAVSAQSYAMRGEIVRLPAAGTREMAIRHEAVPDFRDETGKIVGMEAMTMPFALASAVAIEGLAPGDRVAFTLEMRWQDPREIVRISRIEKLPADARLAWDPPASAVPAAPAEADGTPSN